MFRMFPFLNKIEKKSASFCNYYSSATSTLMVIGDLVYGGMEQYEVCDSLDDIPEQYYYKESLFDELATKGYHTGLFIYPDGGDRESAEKRHIAGFQNTMVLKQNYEEYLQALEQGMNKEPFALMACNYISNQAINYYAVEEASFSGDKKWESGYRQLDKGVEDLFMLMEKTGVCENTTVILYGDHGDDYYGHGMHKGLTHAIEPYTNLVHTPLFILDDKMESGIYSELVSAVDLRKIATTLLENEPFEFEKRQLCFARNEYAAQPVREGIFNKGYSVTDGKLILMISNYGMELYDAELDPDCTNNFLRFFIYDSEKEVLLEKKENYENYKFHFPWFMNADKIRFLRQKFYFLKHQLYEEIIRLYQIAGRDLSDIEKEIRFKIRE